MSKTIAIIQSNYIPWKGYFDIINKVDEFILYDDMQYTRRDWRNRNKIKTQNGLQWLTIPVEVKGKYFQKMKDTAISDLNWGKKHWLTILHNYRNATFFKDFKELFEEVYLNNKHKYLSRINYQFIEVISEILGIRTKISLSVNYDLSVEDKTEKLIHLCKQTSADVYISGPSAKNYMDESLFKKEGIKLEYMDYSGYLKYKQLFPPFEHGVSIIDLIFNEGYEAKKYMLSF